MGCSGPCRSLPCWGQGRKRAAVRRLFWRFLGSAVLHPLPFGAVGDVSELDALGLQLIADAVGLGKILGLLGIGPGADQRLHSGIGLAGLADDGELTGGRSSRGR